MAARKSRGLALAAPFILLALLAVGWGFAWTHFRIGLEDRMDTEAARLRGQGYQVQWANRKVDGFPFRYHVTLTDAVIAEPGGWGIAAPTLEAEAAAYDPRVVVFVAPVGLDLSRPRRGTVRITGEALRMSLGGLPATPPRISIEGVNLTLAAKSGPPPGLSAIQRFEAHFQPGENDAARLFLRIDKAKPAANSILARIAASDTATIGLEGEVTKVSALRGAGAPGALSAWSTAGGAFNLKTGGVAVGKALVSAGPGALTADPGGMLQGNVLLSLTGSTDAVLALGAVGALPQETAAVATGLAAVTSAGQGAQATFTFSGGQTLIGPLPIGPAPRLY